MSETEQQKNQTFDLAKENAGWGANVGAQTGNPDIEEIKKHLDTRSTGEKLGEFGDKVVNGVKTVPAYIAEDPLKNFGRSMGLLAEGVVESAASCGTIVLDIATALTYDPGAALFNATTTGIWGEEAAWKAWEDKGGFMSLTEAAVKKIEFVEPTSLYLKDGVTKNPHANTEFVLKGIGTGVGDTVMFVGSAGGMGAVLGSLKNAKYFALPSKIPLMNKIPGAEFLARGTKSLEYTKTVTHVDDAIELIKKSKKLTTKSAGETGRAAADLMEKSQKKLQKADDVLHGKKGDTVIDNLHRKIDPSTGGTANKQADLDAYVGEKFSRKVQKIEAKGLSETAKTKKLDAIQEKLDEGVNKVAERLGLKTYKAEDALHLANKVQYTNTGSYLGNIIEGARVGAARGVHFTDPLRNPWMEIPGFGLASYLSYSAGKGETQEKEDDANKVVKEMSGVGDTTNNLKALLEKEKAEAANKPNINSDFGKVKGASQSSSKDQPNLGEDPLRRNEFNNRGLNTVIPADPSGQTNTQTPDAEVRKDPSLYLLPQ